VIRHLERAAGKGHGKSDEDAVRAQKIRERSDTYRSACLNFRRFLPPLSIGDTLLLEVLAVFTSMLAHL
jgi:hypothetical protein